MVRIQLVCIFLERKKREPTYVGIFDADVVLKIKKGPEKVRLPYAWFIRKNWASLLKWFRCTFFWWQHMAFVNRFGNWIYLDLLIAGRNWLNLLRDNKRLSNLCALSAISTCMIVDAIMAIFWWTYRDSSSSLLFLRLRGSGMQVVFLKHRLIFNDTFKRLYETIATTIAAIATTGNIKIFLNNFYVLGQWKFL